MNRDTMSQVVCFTNVVFLAKSTRYHVNNILHVAGHRSVHGECHVIGELECYPFLQVLEQSTISSVTLLNHVLSSLVVKPCSS